MHINEEIRYYKNGFIIKSIDCSKNNNYLGIDGYVWPVLEKEDRLETNEAKYLNDYVDNNITNLYDDNNKVDVSCDIAFLNRYIKACNKVGFKIEILFCETERGIPICNIDLSKNSVNFEFIGYDYRYAGYDYYSCVYNDVKRMPQMSHLILNDYDLFDNEAGVIEFINLREQLKKELAKMAF